jgi:hypothetical protein
LLTTLPGAVVRAMPILMPASSEVLTPVRTPSPRIAPSLRRPVLTGFPWMIET